MKTHSKALKYVLRGLLVLVLVGALLLVYVGGSSQFFSGAAEDYYNALLAQGFPADYAAALTELHLLHPTWSFTPLLVTSSAPAYTWEYVLDEESKNPENNLISGATSYLPYRHLTNTEVYDTGYYQVSRAGLSYFMDPRNFLNEADIFQFLDLSSTDAGIEAVRAVLKGTFMENGTLENGKTYADYVHEVGLELGVNPVYLAVKIRQEMGVNGTSPVISGSCGSLLASYWRDKVQISESGTSVLTPTEGDYDEDSLTALDGYYNYFNVSASGSGTFTIYYKAMQAAVKGTPAMAEEWGGSPSWNTRWKAIYGGAYVVKTRYVDAYKSTVYLQKFNVDSRASDNFWGQYAQNVTAAVSEARTLFGAFASNGAADGACSFLIPVYDGMPKHPSSDPAGGLCAATAPATSKYDHKIHLRTPQNLTESNAPLYTDYSVEAGTSVRLAGTVEHSYGLAGLEYSWDGGSWQPLPLGESFDFELSTDISDIGAHILLLRGRADFDVSDSTRKSSYAVLFAVVYVQVTPPPSAEVELRVGDTVTTQTAYVGQELQLPTCSDIGFLGWLGDDGSFLPSGASVLLRADQGYRACFTSLKYMNGAALTTEGPTALRFYATLPKTDLDEIRTLLPGSVSSYAVLYKDTVQVATLEARELSIRATDGTDTWRLHADTPTLAPTDYQTPYSMHFYLRVRYTDGTEQDVYAAGFPSLRSAADVAAMALEDPYYSYTTRERTYLNAIVSTT